MTSDAVKMAKEALRPFSLDIRPEVPGDTMMDTLAWSADQHRAASLALAALEQAGEPVAGIGHGEEADYAELKRLYNFSDDDSAQFTRWNMLTAIRHGKRLGQEFDAGDAVRVLDGANSHCFDMRIVVGDGDANVQDSGAEIIAFANEPWASRIAAALAHPPQSRVAAEPVGLREALEWYGEQARLCRLIHSEGDAGRHALQDDGGKRAKAALATSSQPDPQSREPSLTVADAWQDLVEKDDRTSPEEYPNMALITREELADYMHAAKSRGQAFDGEGEWRS